MKAARILVVLGSAAAVAGAGTALAAAGQADPATTAPAARVHLTRTTGVGRTAADRAAAAYVTAHYPGSGRAQVLATEPDDTDRGQAVWDVQVLAPNGTRYEVHVSMASGTVLSAGRAEGQVSAGAPAAPARTSERTGGDDTRHAMDDTESVAPAEPEAG